MAGKRRQWGSVRRLPSGRHQVRYFDQAGREHNAPTTFATAAEADRFLAVTRTDMLRGEWTDARRGRMPFSELVAIWYGGKTDLRPRTLDLYGYCLSRHILPTFASVPVGDIDSIMIRNWWNELLSTVTHNTATKPYKLLRQILDVAVDDGIIPRNPCRIKGAATESEKEQRSLTPAEVTSLADAIDPRYRALVLTAALAGLRWGELVGLRRKHIDLLHRRLTVEGQVSEDDSGRFVDGPPKTAAGLRTIALSTTLVTELDWHLRNWGGEGPDGLVFPAPDGGYLRRSNFNRRVWAPALTKSGLGPLRPHDLRHTAATLALHVGANARDVMERIGHASPRAAFRYQHRMPGTDEAIAEGLDHLMTPPPEATPGGSEVV